jgi:hypothetical protein
MQDIEEAEEGAANRFPRQLLTAWLAAKSRSDRYHVRQAFSALHSWFKKDILLLLLLLLLLLFFKMNLLWTRPSLPEEWKWKPRGANHH